MEHTWSIYNLNRTITDNVVTSIDYQLQSSVDAPTHIQMRTLGSLSISGSIEDEDFIPYNDLTEEVVLGWVMADINQSEMEAEISASLALLVNDYIEPVSAQGLPEAFNPSEEEEGGE